MRPITRRSPGQYADLATLRGCAAVGHQARPAADHALAPSGLPAACRAAELESEKLAAAVGLSQGASDGEQPQPKRQQLQQGSRRRKQQHPSTTGQGAVQAPAVAAGGDTRRPDPGAPAAGGAAWGAPPMAPSPDAQPIQRSQQQQATVGSAQRVHAVQQRPGVVPLEASAYTFAMPLPRPGPPAAPLVGERLQQAGPEAQQPAALAAPGGAAVETPSSGSTSLFQQPDRGIIGQLSALRPIGAVSALHRSCCPLISRRGIPCKPAALTWDCLR